MKNETKLGFTLIELIITVVVIGILSGSLLVLINPSEVLNRGRYAKVDSDINNIIESITLSQIKNGQVLGEIIGSWDSASGCDGDLRDSTGTCYQNWIDARDAINTSLRGQVDLSSIDRDPWGSPYIIMANEGRVPATPCIHDAIITVGPDGLLETADDKSFTVPFYDCY